MEEYWDVYDRFRNRTGEIIQRDGNRWLKQEEYHIVITGIIENSRKQILITKRKEDKKVFPGLWECTGGSVKSGETSIEATIREIKEEIGIELKKEEAIFLGTIKKDNYFRDVWKFEKDIEENEVSYNDGEVIDSKWVTIDEYNNLYKLGKIVPSGDFVIKFLDEKELEEER